MNRRIFGLVSLFFVFGLLQPVRSAPSISNEHSEKNALNCKCRFGVAKRIIGGGKATKNFIPWMVSIAVQDKHYCGVS